MDKRRRETWLTRLLINYPPRSLRRYNKMISGRLYRDSGCERPSRHKVAACAPAAVVINNAARGSREAAAVVGPCLYGPSRRTAPRCNKPHHRRRCRENLVRTDRVGPGTLNSYTNLLHKSTTPPVSTTDTRGLSVSVHFAHSFISCPSR